MIDSHLASAFDPLAHSFVSLCIAVCSNNTAVEFGALLEDQAVPNDYQGMVKELRTAHAQLNGDKQQALTTKLQEQVSRGR